MKQFNHWEKGFKNNFFLDMGRILKDNLPGLKCFQFLEFTQFLVLQTQETQETQ